MSEESVTVADEVVPVGKGKPRSASAKKAIVKNAKAPKEAVVTTKYKPKDKPIGRASDLLKMVGDKTRIAVLLNLSQGPLNVSELCKVIGTSQPALSHHLALMRGPSIVEADRDGKSNYYSLSGKGKTLVKLIKSVMESNGE